MSTVAFKDGLIAYDSRETVGITIFSDQSDKCYVRGERRFFLVGNSYECEEFADQYPNVAKKNQAHGFLVEDGKVYLVAVDADRTYKLLQEVPWAVGSGGDHALTALDLGCDARKAVEYALKRDTCSGGEIKTFKAF